MSATPWEGTTDRAAERETTLVNQLLSDLRFALRQLRRSQGFALTAILTLGLGIGASAAVYCVIHAVLLSPLPYPAPDRLVGLALTFPHQPAEAEQAGTSADFLRENMNEFSSVAVIDDGATAVNLSDDGGHAAKIASLRVSEGYFRTFGVSAAMGHTFTADEDRPGGGRTAVLSHSLWVRQFGADPSIVGRSIRMNEESYTVIGVMPASFAVTAEIAQGVFGAPDLWTPLQLSPKDPGYEGDNYKMIARLRPGISLAQVQHHLDALVQPFYQKFPGYKKWVNRDNKMHEFRVWPLQAVLVRAARRSLLVVFAAVLAVLLTACLNLAGLMIARSLRRSREMAVRSALGATRGQLLRLLLCEGLLIASGGGLLGIAVARICVELLLHQTPLPLPSIAAVPGAPALSGAVLLIALVATAVFALAPVLVFLRWKKNDVRLGTSPVGETVSHAKLSRSLIVAQVALAMVLLSTASVLLGTFLKLRSTDTGMEPRQLTVFQVALKGDAYANTRHTTQFVASVLERLRHAPGVNRVAAINGLPLDRGLNIGGFPVSSPEKNRNTIEFRTVTPGYFQTMGIPILSGRDISSSDGPGSDHVVLISAATAREYWPTRSPIGELFRADSETWRIIGVVGDTRQHSLLDSGDIVLYAPMAQLPDQFTGILNGWFPTTFAVRTAAHVDLLRITQQAVEHADSQIPVSRFTTMQTVIDSTFNQERFYSILATSFSVFSLILTVIGLFGLLNYQVSQRTREIGVRMAMGADRQNILFAILRRGLALVVAGIAVGLAVCWLVRPMLRLLLADAGIHGDSAPTVIMNGTMAALAAALTLTAAAVIASWFPARRAASVEPMQALRTE